MPAGVSRITEFDEGEDEEGDDDIEEMAVERCRFEGGSADIILST